MKKTNTKCLLSICFILIMTGLSFSKVSVAVNYTTANTEYQYLDNGIICVTIITTNTHQGFTRASASTSGSKTVNYKNASGAILWHVKVSASFSYNGSTSSYKTASANAGSANSKRKVSDIKSSRTGKSGTACATGKDITVLVLFKRL